jgi:hypothetical protein
VDAAVLYLAAAAVLIFAFETWVFLGVRQIRFGNPPHARPAAPDPAADDPP